MQLLLLLNLAHLAAMLAAIATFLGFLGEQWWRFELLDHLRPQYCLILGLGLLAGGILGQWWAMIWWVPLAVNFGLFLPLFLRSSRPTSPNLPALRLLHANLDRHNPQPDRVIQFLQQQSVDLMLLQEITPAWLQRLETELPNYRVVKALAFDNTLGSAVLVPSQNQQFQIEKVQVIHLPQDSDRPLLETTIIYKGQPLVVLSFHVIRPGSQYHRTYQRVEFNAAIAWAQQHLQQQHQVVLIGDFNSTPWSGRLRRLERESQLSNSQRGFGLQPTWSAQYPALMRIAIDHCFHSRSLVTVGRSVGTDIGSDHFPILVDLQ
jgi:endonuclease/exonuclease/phosphatase (EEP) superfamily protein YafD